MEDLETVLEKRRDQAGRSASAAGFYRPKGAAKTIAPRRMVRTSGVVSAEPAIYIGQFGPRLFKIGQSGEPGARCRNLGAKLVYWRSVTREAAREVEAEALISLGATTDCVETVVATYDEVLRAVANAFERVSRRMHVDPTISAEEARAQRIAAYQGSI